MSANISVNARAAALVERLIADAAELKIGVTRGTGGAANFVSRCSTGTTRSANRRMFNSPCSCGMPP